MLDLMKKLNMLVRAGINEVLEGDPLAPRTSVSPARLGATIDREIASLRDRVNDAVTYEDRLRGQVNTFHAEIDRLDIQADQAVADGQDDQARIYIDQMRRAQQRLAMAQSDLQAHQRVTQELLMRVNEMETWVEEAKRSQRERDAQSETASAQTDAGALPSIDSLEAARGTLADVLRRAQETISKMGDLMASARGEADRVESASEIAAADADRADAARYTAPASAPTAPLSTTARPPSTGSVDDDLQQRRNRLSKR